MEAGGQRSDAIWPGDAKAYVQLLEQARMAYVEKHGYEAGVFSLPRFYTDEPLQQADERLRQAEETAASSSPLHRQRVQCVRAGLTWTRWVAENARLMASYWQRKDEAMAARALANWATMEQSCNEHPYAINWGPCRPANDRMLDLHPESTQTRNGIADA